MQNARSVIGIRNLEYVRSLWRTESNRHLDDELVAIVVNDDELRSPFVTDNSRLAVKARTKDIYIFGKAPSAETMVMTTVKAMRKGRRWVLCRASRGDADANRRREYQGQDTWNSKNPSTGHLGLPPHWLIFANRNLIERYHAVSRSI